MKKIKILLLSLLVASCYYDSDTQVADIEQQVEQSKQSKQEKQKSAYEIVVDDFEEDTFARTLEAVSSAVEGYTVSPTTVRGGTMDVLTITGTGFGTESYRVNIGGGASVGGWQIDIWTETLIQFRVPSNGRTGNVTVILPDLTEIIVGSVTVKWGIYNATGTVGDSYDWFRNSHKGNIDNEMVWHFELGISESIKQDFRDALDEWNCKIGINWSLGEDLDLIQQTSTDGINGVFLGSSPGGAHFGVRWADCGNNTWYMFDGEIVFDEMKDYKTMLHEIGHAVQLTHTYGQGGIMGTSGGSAISSGNIEAGLNVMNWNTTHTLGCVPDIIDTGCVPTQTYYQDADGDTFGNPNVSKSASSLPDGYVTNNQDCDDTNPLINPNAFDILDNGIDENCDGKDSVSPTYTFYRDADGDTFGDPSNTITITINTPPTGYVRNNQDCDDNNSTINPDATEIKGNKIDENCNGMRDDRIKGPKGPKGPKNQ